MTQILRKRTMRPEYLHHLRGPDGHAWRFDARHDATELAAQLRSLALRAHHALKRGASLRDESSRQELHDLRTEIGQLLSQVQNQRLDRLATYVAALRRRVEASLD